MSQALFASMQQALTFAFEYAHNQSPHTPMTRLMQGPALGSGKGLVGVDGAGQAGFILGAVDRVLSPEQRAVLLVRFCAHHREACLCCGHTGHPKWWHEMVSSLSCSEGLHDLAKPIREAIVMKTVARQKLRVQDQARSYDVAERTIRRRISAAKDRFGRIENAALQALTDHFTERDAAGKRVGSMLLEPA